MKNKVLNLGFIIGIISLVWFVVQWQQKCIKYCKSQADKNKAMFLVTKQWLSMKQEGKRLEDYFIKNNYKKIAIYGMGDLGKCMVKELNNSDIEIKYGIDRNAKNIYSDIKILTVNDSITDVDAVVITVLGEFDSISKALYKKIDCPMIAIEDIVNEI